MFNYHSLKTLLIVVVVSIFFAVPVLAQPLGVLPDPRLTSGAVDSAVTQANIMSTICVHGYTARVRHVTAAEKREDLARYHQALPDWPAGPYEIDHLISLELGGSNDINNLWPEPMSLSVIPAQAGIHVDDKMDARLQSSGMTDLGARKKDRVENYLHRQVCEGRISLKDAQEEISHDWVKVYEGMEGK